VLIVEVDQDDTESAEHLGRDWAVRLRRGADSLVVARGLGRFSATAFATELHSFIERRGPRRPEQT
jgi:hypothetical protein